MTEVTVTTDQPKGSVFKKVLVALIVLGLIAFAIYYYAWPKSDDNDTPPVLGPSADDQLQGMMVLEKGLLKFEGNPTETAAHVCTRASYIEAPVGVNYFYTKETVSYQDIINAIKPVAGLEVVIAYYNVLGYEPYGAPNSDKDKNFFVHPNPWPAKATTVPATDKQLSNYKIPPYMGFAILVNKKSMNLCNTKFGNSKEKLVLANQDAINSFWNAWFVGLMDFEPVFEMGSSYWMMLPVNQKDVLDVLLLGDSVVSAWMQTGQNTFVSLDIGQYLSPASVSLGDYQMIWLKFEGVDDEEEGDPVVEDPAQSPVVDDPIEESERKIIFTVGDVLRGTYDYAYYSFVDEDTRDLFKLDFRADGLEEGETVSVSEIVIDMTVEAGVDGGGCSNSDVSGLEMTRLASDGKEMPRVDLKYENCKFIGGGFDIMNRGSLLFTVKFGGGEVVDSPATRAPQYTFAITPSTMIKFEDKEDAVVEVVRNDLSFSRGHFSRKAESSLGGDEVIPPLE